MLIFDCVGSRWWRAGLVARQDVGSSFPARDGTGVPCAGRWTLNHWTTGDGPAFPPEFHPAAYSSLLWTCRDAQPISGSARPTQPRRGSLGSGAFSLAEGVSGEREWDGHHLETDACRSRWPPSGGRGVRSPSWDTACAKPKAGRGVRAARAGARCVRAGGTGKESGIPPPPGAHPPSPRRVLTGISPSPIYSNPFPSSSPLWSRQDALTP